MNFWLISVLTFLCFINISFEQECSDAGMELFDQDIAKVMTAGESNRTFPENVNEMKIWCKQSRGYLDEIDKYNSNCNKNLFKRLVNLYVYGFRRTVKLYCRAGSKAGTALMTSSPCWNKNKKIEISCVNDFIDTLLGAHNEPDAKKKIPHFCCAFYKFTNCFEERLTGQPNCDENKLTAMKNYLQSTSTNAIDFFCGTYKDDNDKCNKLGLPPKKKKSQKRTKSPAIPSAQLFDSIAEF